MFEEKRFFSAYYMVNNVFIKIKNPYYIIKQLFVAQPIVFVEINNAETSFFGSLVI